MKILDTTIRDGSYAIDFKFTCEDVTEIAARLEKLGMEYIEIGHGMGLNASSPENGISLHTDMEYMHAVKRVLKKPSLDSFVYQILQGWKIYVLQAKRCFIC